ncbi:cytochrome c [Pontibacter qinzhouensis]|uniref:Cytochrome c n=1 Tax=Pontibacter qinzhouensis TaxID=2603253 RepID=A0A5C8KBQ4_9BACT|nr:c-type cytochrome [Pontibacter qinzhouensis]TXK49273.1 cytochrome c [Pontibacter qinzhouensis]
MPLLLLFACRSRDAAIEELQNSRDAAAIAETEDWPATFGFGKAATASQIALLDTDVRPDGRGLPVGSGDVVTGRKLYAAKCAACHGATGTEGPFDKLVTAAGARGNNGKTIGTYWPYATTLYDYINRAMPFNAPGSLTPDEVYSLTAYLLHANNILPADAVMTAQSLPQVQMPAKERFITDDRKGGAEVR